MPVVTSFHAVLLLYTKSGRYLAVAVEREHASDERRGG